MLEQVVHWTLLVHKASRWSHFLLVFYFYRTPIPSSLAHVGSLRAPLNITAVRPVLVTHEASMSLPYHFYVTFLLLYFTVSMDACTKCALK